MSNIHNSNYVVYEKSRCLSSTYSFQYFANGIKQIWSCQLSLGNIGNKNCSMAVDSRRLLLYLMRPFKSYWTELAGRPTAQVRIKELNDKLSIVLFICFNRYLLKYFPWPQIDPRYNKRRLILKSLIKIRFLTQNFHMY